ncbi:MAG: PEP-CTERM sorting domain-containing protein [Cyanobacteria bacterium SBLK]|nr:PEP-CTERM sorting domain-containing protein [Cyanobacteria bacterium SBLK]
MKWINTAVKMSLAAIAFVVIAPPDVHAGTLTLEAGCKDNFALSENCPYANQNGGEVPQPSDELKTLMENYSQGLASREADFDGQDVNQVFGHTFKLPEKGTIKSAQLEIHLNPLGEILQTDQIHLLFIDDSGQDSIRWGRQIGSSNGTEGLLPTEWKDSSHLFILDLANLPLASNQDPNIFATNLIAKLNEKRFLDVYFQDDSSVDYVALQIETVPEPGISLLGLMGLTALGACLRDRKTHQD